MFDFVDNCCVHQTHSTYFTSSQLGTISNMSSFYINLTGGMLNLS